MIVMAMKSAQNIHAVDAINREFACPTVVHILKCAATKIVCGEFHQ
jgi:hypothetical protein